MSESQLNTSNTLNNLNNLKTLSALPPENLKGKRVLIRVDFNVPLDKNKHITSDIRIQAALPTIQYCLENGAFVILMSHLGRPKEGEFDPEFSLKPVFNYLKNLELLKSYQLDFLDLNNLNNLNNSNLNLKSNLILLENVRFWVGEKNNCKNLSQKLANLCDIFVNDAFGSAHRAHASTTGVAEYADLSCAGFLLEAEIKALSTALNSPQKPVVAIVAGSKVSTKLTVLKNLIHKVDTLIVGGGIANTFLLVSGFKMGNSLVEKDLISEAKNLITQMAEKNGEIPLPVDVRVSNQFSEESEAVIKNLSENNINSNEMVLDIGPETAEILAEKLKSAGTIIWNGPVGVFEFKNFRNGTYTLAKAIAESDGFSIAGGGDTLAAIDLFGLKDKISYISTGGGAFLEFMEGQTLPAVAVLEKN